MKENPNGKLHTGKKRAKKKRLGLGVEEFETLCLAGGVHNGVNSCGKLFGSPSKR